MIQYAHTHRDPASQPATLAIQDLTKAHLHSLFTQHANKLLIQAGLSVVSPHDHFVKSTGRAIAIARIVPTVADLSRIKIDGTTHRYYFTMDALVGGRRRYVNFIITSVAESEQVNLVFAELCNE